MTRDGRIPLPQIDWETYEEGDYLLHIDTSGPVPIGTLVPYTAPVAGATETVTVMTESGPEAVYSGDEWVTTGVTP